jgi:hypothetical protein
MTLVRATRLTRLIELARRGPGLIEPAGTRGRPRGRGKADDVVRTGAVTIEESVTGGVIDVCLHAPNTGLSTC